MHRNPIFVVSQNTHTKKTTTYVYSFGWFAHWKEALQGRERQAYCVEEAAEDAGDTGAGESGKAEPSGAGDAWAGESGDEAEPPGAGETGAGEPGG